MTLPTCPLCHPDGRPRTTETEIGDPDRYCTVNAHRELAVQAADLARWNEHMWAADDPTPDPEPEQVSADQQETML